MKIMENKTKTIFLALTFLGIFGLAGNVWAADYYVSPTGTAAWSNCGAPAKNGAEACSWQTAMANAVAGDTVFFRGGTYNLGIFDNDYGSLAENVRMYPANSGTIGNPIIFIAYPGETPDITGTVTATSQESWFGCGNTNNLKNYITWDGFSATMKVNKVIQCYDGVDNDGDSYIDGADPQCTMGLPWNFTRYPPGDNSESSSNVNAAPDNTYFETAIFRVAGDHCTIKNSHFTGVDVGGGWAQNTTFVRVLDATNALVENNYLHDLISASDTAVNTAAVYFQMLSNISTVRNNTIVDCEGGIYGKGNSANVSIHNNFIYNSSNTGSRGIWYVRSATTGEAITTRRIYQNVIAGYNPGIWFESTGIVIPADGSLVYNNTVYSNSGNGTGVEIDTDHINTQVFNNIITNRVPYLRYYNGTVSYSNYNNFYNIAGNNWQVGYSPYTSLVDWTSYWRSTIAIEFDLNSTTANPNFVNASGLFNQPADFKRTAYPADGRGGAYASVIGAYITGDEVIGYVAPTADADTTPPSAPSGLEVQ